MKLKSVLLTAIGLLGLVNATAIVQTNALEVTVAASSVLGRSPDPANCDKYCHQPWLKCYNKCGGGDDCAHYCNCGLFGDPHLFCRHAKCVENPSTCHGIMMPPVAGRAGGAQVTNVEASQGESNNFFVKPFVSIEARVPNPCVVCQTAINSCKKKCTDDTCKDACNCYHKQYNANCKECSISCNSLEQRDTESAQDTDGESSVDSANVAIGVPIPPCVSCLFSVNSCKKKCNTKGACDDACNCYHKKSTICKECKLPCNCHHSCPRLAPTQRRAGIDFEIAEDIELAQGEA